MAFFSLPWWERLLRLSVVFAFLYPPIAALSDPYSWIGYFPAFLTNLAAPHELLLLHAFGALEVLLALWMLFGRRPWLAYAPATLILLAIVIVSPAQFPVLFRDLSIALVSFALALLYRRPLHA